MAGRPARGVALCWTEWLVCLALGSGYKRFLVAGTQHTAAGALDTTQVGSLSLRQWLTAMLEGDSAWVDTLE